MPKHAYKKQLSPSLGGLITAFLALSFAGRTNPCQQSSWREYCVHLDKLLTGAALFMAPIIEIVHAMQYSHITAYAFVLPIHLIIVLYSHHVNVEPQLSLNQTVITIDLFEQNIAHLFSTVLKKLECITRNCTLHNQRVDLQLPIMRAHQAKNCLNELMRIKISDNKLAPSDSSDAVAKSSKKEAVVCSR
jgi:hypothetical protein